MTNKVQKIREEVVRIHKLLPVMDGDNIYVNYADRICTTIEMYIDSLQEEPVSEDLEQAIDNYLATYWGGEKEKQDRPFLKKMAIHFSNWQKQQMLKDTVEAEVQWHDGFLLMYDEHEVEDLLLPDIKVGDKVRLAVIKED